MCVKPKMTWEEVRDYFAEFGCQLISSEYTGVSQSLSYKCHCGNESRTTLSVFRQKGKRCKKCAVKAATETNKQKRDNGTHYSQTQEYKDMREKRSLEKYGTKFPSQSNQVKKKMKRTFLKKYGVSHCSQIPEVKQKKIDTCRRKNGVDYQMQVPEIFAKHRATLKKRHGVDNLAYLSSTGTSNESQKLFKSIKRRLKKELRDKCYFSSFQKEFVITYEGKNYKYDFVNTILKKCIEYNGFNFHPRPEQSEDEIGWCAFHPNKTVKEAREYEKHKYSGLEARGYQILTIWDYEMKRDFESTVKRCMEFLLS